MNEIINEDVVEDLVLQDNIKKVESIKPSKQKLKEEICKVIWVKPNIFTVDFKGYGVTVDGKINSSLDSIKIKYQGEIGLSDFKIIGFE